jgi:hypothetical protein
MPTFCSDIGNASDHNQSYTTGKTSLPNLEHAKLCFCKHVTILVAVYAIASFANRPGRIANKPKKRQAKEKRQAAKQCELRHSMPFRDPSDAVKVIHGAVRPQRSGSPNPTPLAFTWNWYVVVGFGASVFLGVPFFITDASSVS